MAIDHLGWISDQSDSMLERGSPKFGSNWPSSFRDVFLNMPFFHNHKKLTKL